MHEIRLARQVAESLLAELAKRPGATAKRVVVELSEFSGVVEHLFRHGFGHAAGGTALAGAALEVRQVGLAFRCPECDRVHDEDEGECLDCGTTLLPERPPDARVVEFVIDVPEEG